MLKRVEPLRNELQKLEDDAKDNKTKAEEVEQMIRDLEASIARYKEEYAVLISEAQAIKADLAAVEAKVTANQIWNWLKNLQFYLSELSFFFFSLSLFSPGESQHSPPEESVSWKGALGEDKWDLQEPDVHHCWRLSSLRCIHYLCWVLWTTDETEPVHYLVSPPAAGQHSGT